MIRKPQEQEQSIWLDYPGRDLVRSDELTNLVQSGKMHGVTTEALCPGGQDARATPDPNHGNPLHAMRTAFIAEVRMLADILYPSYIRTRRREGYVSVPLDPAVASDTEAILAEARRLWSEIARKNLLLAIPATDAGIPAISTLVAEGINVNATMLFTPRKYEQAALGYMEGLEKFAASDNSNICNEKEPEDGESTSPRSLARIAHVAGIASFLLSPIDTAIDTIISSHLNQCGLIKTYSALEREALRGLVGKAAIASAKAAYGRFQAIFSGPRWEALVAMGAQKQRLLWAGTTVENLAYRETRYLDALGEPNTIMSISPALLAAYTQHAEQGPSRKSGWPSRSSRSPDSPHEYANNASVVLSELKKLHISLDEIAERLLSSRLKRQADACADTSSRFPGLRG